MASKVDEIEYTLIPIAGEECVVKNRLALILSLLALGLALVACIVIAWWLIEGGLIGGPGPTPTPSASISGVLWHEICRYTGGEAGEPVVLGEGCVQWGPEPWQFGPNQVQDDFEEGWEGVTMRLGSGPCPSHGLATTDTDADGNYSFEGLEAGTYCVSYSSLEDGNDVILIPGGPTYPERGEEGFQQEVELSSGEAKTGVDFGYAWQFYD